jgi:hypothetical protein
MAPAEPDVDNAFAGMGREHVDGIVEQALVAPVEHLPHHTAAEPAGRAAKLPAQAEQ